MFGTLEADEVFNDNIYATSNATGKTAAFIQLINPTLELRSDWTNHMLNVYAKGGFGFYSVDRGSITIRIFRLAPMRASISSATGTSMAAPPGTVATTSLVLPTHPMAPACRLRSTTSLPANVGYFQTFNRFNVRLDGRFDNYKYLTTAWDPHRALFPTVIATATNFARPCGSAISSRLATRSGCAAVSTSGNIFSSIPLASTAHRTGFDIVGGMIIDLGGITAVEIFAGYLQQTYVSGQFSTISTPTFGLIGYWNPIRGVWVKPFIRRTVDDSALQGTAAYINTSGGLDVDYHLLPNIRLRRAC